jgi:hypothetical protein
MKHYTFAAYGAYSRCDDPVQPDGTWQRRMDYDDTFGEPAVHWRKQRCSLMGPGQNPWASSSVSTRPHRRWTREPFVRTE